MAESPSGPQIHDLAKDANQVLAQYLSEHSPAFVKLSEIRKKGWANPEGDKYWHKRRENADAATQDTPQAKTFYKMTQEIAVEMHAKTSALTPGRLGFDTFQSLDLCMAPGGFTWGTLKYNPTTIVYGITLPLGLGGYKNCVSLPIENVKFMDITMLSTEFGTATIPPSHPDHSLFLTERPFADQRFQLIFCGGAVLQGHERAEYRRNVERTRLTTSQLMLGMQRIVPGGTMVVLLKKPEAWSTVRLLSQFSSFADIQLCKPKKKHAERSTFYLVAKNVRSESESAKDALEEWKRSWVRATFGGNGTIGQEDEVDDETVSGVLEEFGREFVELATSVWETQASALERQDLSKARNKGWGKKKHYWPGDRR